MENGGGNTNIANGTSSRKHRPPPYHDHDHERWRKRPKFDRYRSSRKRDHDGSSERHRHHHHHHQDHHQQQQRAYLEKDVDGNNVLKFGSRSAQAGAKEIISTRDQVQEEQPTIKKENVPEEQVRSYQLEVLEQAKSRNTIAFLETGAGKTLIAVLLMKSKSETLGRKMLTVFLVPKVPLVYQQAEVIRTRTNFIIGHYCGEMGQDFWDSRRWRRELESKEVFVMTAQILLNILRHSIVRMEDIDLLIMDECHHAVKKHPYSLVMSEFYHLAPKDKRPAVFGMTASPVNLKGVSSQQDCAIKIRNLETKLDSVVCTIRDRKELEKYVPMPFETVIEYDRAALLWSLREQIKQIESEVIAAAGPTSKRSKWQFMGARDAGVSDEPHLMYGVAERTEADGASNLLQKFRAIIYALEELGQWCAYKVASSYLAAVRNDERGNHQSDGKFQDTYLKRVAELLHCELKEGAAVPAEPKTVTEDGATMDVEDGEICDTKAVSGGEHSDEILGAAVADGKVTPKVQCLIKLLLQYKNTDDFRAIIFVDRVVAASVLPKIISELPSLQFLNSATLTGQNNNQDVRTSVTHESLAKFRDGRVTLLVATSVAEEGLDIRQCNVVIRFDLAKTVLAYIQSRGRARKPGSNYILMVERGNKTHQGFLRNARNSEETLRKEANERTVLDWTKEAEIQASIEAAHEEIYKAASGAIVSLNSAVGLVHFYCSQLPSDRYSVLKPEFIINFYQVNGASTYSCRLQLPCNAPIESVEGPVCETIKKARQSACLEACKRLHELGAFTDMLLPDKGEKADKKAEEEIGEALPGTARYREYYPEGVAEILKDDWIVADRVSYDVYMYKVQSINMGSSKDPLTTQASEFAILFGRKLDAEVLTMSMDLFVARTLTTKVSLDYSGLYQFSSSEINLLKAFHVRLMSIVLDVNVEPSASIWDAKKAYVFVPLVSGTPKCRVDWGLINQVLNTNAWSNALQRARPDAYLGTDERSLGGDRKEYSFAKLRNDCQKHPTYGVRGAVAPYNVVSHETVAQDMDTRVDWKDGHLLMAEGLVSYEEVAGKIVTARHSGKRFYVESIRLDMNADSPFPRKEGYLGAVEYATYRDYYKQKYGVDLVCPDQPMIRARGVSHCKNLLSPRFNDNKVPDGPELTEKTYYVMLPAELCLIHPLPGYVVRGAQRLPSVMRRVESMLLAIQLKHEISYPIPAAKVLEALTAASCQESFCYERAELLGDAFLKWIVSRRLFLKFPNKHEGQLTRMRQQTVSNAVLYEFALSKHLQSYIQADRFAPSRWAAPGVPLDFEEDAREAEDEDEDEEAEKQLRSESDSGALEIELEDDSRSLEEGEIEADMSSYRVLSSKTLADVVEALIGIYYVEGGLKATAHLMGWIGIPIDYDVSEAENAKVGSSAPESVMKSVDFETLETSLGYKFAARNLLVEAISHASRPSAGLPCYQRLEFVGDAVLDHLITRYLFFQYNDLPPGRLTDLRAAAVNNENFARLSVKHGLHLHLRHGSPALENQIRDFVKDIQGELDQPGINSFGIGDFKAPKVLGDILESIAGAIFLDTGLDMDVVWKVFKELLQPIVTPETLPVHPVRELQERCQQQAEDLEYKASRDGSTATVEVFVDGVQISAAKSSQKKMAQKLAARNALVVLKKKSNETVEKEKPEKKVFTRQMLNDICLKRQWSLPDYKVLCECGPPHAKRFTYTVRVCRGQLGWTEECEGQSMPSVRKAKDSAATVLLELLKQSGLD